MDIFLVSLFLLYLIFYFGVQSLLFRTIDRYASVLWQMKLLIGGGTLSFLLTFLILVLDGWSFLNSIFGSSLISFLYSLSISIYLLSVYSYIESSITVKIFTLVGEKTEGISRRQLLKVYNLRVIVKRRIRRFLVQGEITQKGKWYARVSGTSIFSVRERLNKLILFFFP